jgi:predicted nucleic acid-binding protein
VIVVADTSPLRDLILIEHVHVLPTLYGHVVVPPAVIVELNRERTPDLVKTWLSNMPEWLHVQAPMQTLTSPRTVLGAGEREAIALPAELSAEALLIDDRDARQRPGDLASPCWVSLHVLADARSTVLRISRLRSIACEERTSTQTSHSSDGFSIVPRSRDKNDPR